MAQGPLLHKSPIESRKSKRAPEPHSPPSPPVAPPTAAEREQLAVERYQQFLKDLAADLRVSVETAVVPTDVPGYYKTAIVFRAAP